VEILGAKFLNALQQCSPPLHTYANRNFHDFVAPFCRVWTYVARVRVCRLTFSKEPKSSSRKMSE
jgi:hypothetical protein